MISDSQATAWFVHPSGEIMIAPDNRMPPFRGWRRVVTKTIAETEQMSRRMARQQYDKMRSLKVEEHLRHQKKRDAIKANCRIRLAAGCISQEDERLTRMTLASLERKDEMFYRLIANEPDLSRTSLVIEQTEAPIGNAAFSGKRRGLADLEVNAISQLAESVA
jgi:hypothetical protein